MERRKHNRVKVSFPMNCQVQLVDRKACWSIPGVLKNISWGGIYFICETFPLIRRGDVGIFTLNIVEGTTDSSHITAKGQVKRVDHHVLGLTAYGVAVEFLTNPTHNK